MALIPVTNIGDVGVVKDLTPESVASVPLSVWTDCRNVSFVDGAVIKGPGVSAELTPSIDPYQVFYISGTDTAYVVCAGLVKIHAHILGGASGDITRVAGGDYTGGLEDQWLYGDFNGVPVFTNGVDLPQAWVGPGISVPLANLSNWPASTSAKALRGFKSHLVALNITGPSASYPRMVKWSHPASPGAVPTSWDATDASKEAGEAVLIPGDDALVDCLPLGDLNLIYGEMSTFAMRFVGGLYVFAFRPVSVESGLIGPGALCEVRQRHFVVSMDDIILTNGEEIQSVASPKIRKWFFNNVSSSFYRLTKVMVRGAMQEVWILFPTTGSLLDRALIWNWANNTWTILDIGSYSSISTFRILRTAVDRWETEASEQWGGETSKIWNLGLVGSSGYVGSLLLARLGASKKVLRVDASRQVEGVNFTSFVERKWIAPVVGADGTVIPYRPQTWKLLIAIHPRFDVPDGTQFTVEVGTQDDLNGPITWLSPFTYTAGTPKIDVYATGRLFTVRFKHTGSEDWKFYGYDLDVAELGLL